AIELFERKYPHIAVAAEYSGFDGYFDKVNTQIAATNAPDLIQMGGNIREYVDRGALLPLDPYVDGVIRLDDFTESLVNEATFDGRFYGVPLGVSVNSIMYNADMLNDAGVPVPPYTWTYDDFGLIARSIADKLGPGHYGAYDLSGSKSALGDYLISNGK